MTLTKQQYKQLKAKAHHLKPLIRIGQKGITDSVIEEAIQTLERHELVKVHLAQDDRAIRQANVEELTLRCQAVMVHQIGKTCVLYKEKAA